MSQEEASAYVAKTGGQLTTHFHIREFKCKDGTKVPEEYFPNVILLAQNLQILRDYIGEPIHLNSAYRTPTYNASINGAKKSQHLLANAGDITTKNKTPRQLKAIVIKLNQTKGNGFWLGGIGLYAGFLHVDTRTKFTEWYGSGIKK